MFRPLLACILFCMTAPAFAERVVIVSGENRLPAEYMPPIRSGMPAIVLLHGCGGLNSKSGEISSRMLRMGHLFREMGYAVLFLDSFSPRGIRQVCTPKSAARLIPPAQRADDVEAAIRWLRKQKDVDPERIGLIGWSHGADVVLEVLGRHNKAVRAGVAYYPACRLQFSQKHYRISAPALVLIGESDTRTPAADCRALSDQTGQDLFFVVSYPDTVHDFDRPVQAPYTLYDVPNRVRSDEAGYDPANPEAAQDAMRRSFKWFSRWFDPERALKGMPPVNKPRN